MTKQYVLDEIYAIEDAIENGCCREINVDCVMQILTNLSKLVANIDKIEAKTILKWNDNEAPDNI